VIAGLAVTCNAMRRQRLGHRDRSGAEPPGRRAASPPSAGVAHQLPHYSADAPGVDTHKGRSWWGGPGGALHVTFCPGGGRIRAATPCASAQLQHLATQDHRRVVLFGLNDPHFPVFSRETGSVTLLALKIGRSQEF